ncbi:hypothetical protein PQR64_37900 [Paraburkholderia phytofirmans]|uniref:hypothetical protein n=1 Tax=Paraburkholderia phytofirmans TaxID=261302 RepID=UPI0038B6BF96
MEELGLFCAGVFISSIATVSLKYIENSGDWRSTLAVILPAVFSGVALSFTKRFKNEALGCYPLGLVIGLMWNFMEVAKRDISVGDTTHLLVGIAQILGTVAVTGFAVAVVGIPACRYARDLWRSGPTASQTTKPAAPFVNPTGATALTETPLRVVSEKDRAEGREQPAAAEGN